ncbi:MAG: acetyl/propionyl/methylcrotonyl-CoA carboxylase subunit alpha, partial [Mycobacteriales bacterium]|nr:hypothetical protein [Frankia sp.]
MFETILVANRGEIARRIIRSAHELGVKAVAVYSDADERARHVRDADEAVPIGPAPPAQSYLDGQKLVEAAQQSGAQAVHPGYGFLAENASFAQQVIDAGLTWIGPSPDVISEMGDKVNARNRVAAAGVPVAPGTEKPVADVEQAVAEAKRIGYPLMVKAAAGGGGIGMGIAADEAALRAAFETARTRAERFFGDPAILLERYLAGARHVEVQILGLGDGQVVALGERDCSVQRRHQKVAEETPSPGVSDLLRQRMLDAAIRAGAAVRYENAGTIECLVADGDFVFLEMNTRLQVEHPVTELVTGIDIVAEQLRIAAGEPPGFDPGAITRNGHAVEFRVYAEDPVRFLPRPGTITAWEEPTGEGVRVDAGYGEGDVVTTHYDPLLAKLCTWGADRAAALDRMRTAVSEFRIDGPQHNLPFFAELLANAEFASGNY